MFNKYVKMFVICLTISLNLFAHQYRWVSNTQVEVTLDTGAVMVVEGRSVDLSKNKVGLTQTEGIYLSRYQVVVTPDLVIKLGDSRVERRDNSVSRQILGNACHGFLCEYDTRNDHTSSDRYVCLLTTEDTTCLDACVNGWLMP